MTRPKVFISYSSGNEAWATTLATKLEADGADVFFYGWPKCRGRLGSRLTDSIQAQMQSSDYIVMVCTSDYQQKSMRQHSGVGQECSVVTEAIYNEGIRDRLIPIVRGKSIEKSVPGFVTEFKPHLLLFRNAKEEEKDYQTLLYKVRLLPREQIGKARVVTHQLNDFELITSKGVYQGVSFIQLDLGNGSLKDLSFKVRSTSPHWRAGFKLEEPDLEESLPTLVHPGSLLFHVGNSRNSIQPDVFPLVTGYYDQGVSVSEPANRVQEPEVPETNLPWVSVGDEILIEMHSVDGNLVGEVDGGKWKHTFKDVKPELMRNAFLVAWGDHEDAEEKIQREYAVEFSAVKFSTE